MSGNFFSYYFSENSYRNRFFWSVFLLLLIHIAGAIGIAFYDTATFSGMTPYNLIIMFVILLLNENKIDEILILVFVFSFLIGFITELIGVNTGFLFGDYVYGKILGIKFFNVPILIGLNWFTIVFSAYVISAKIINYLPTLFFKKNESSLLKIFSHSILCATIATSFDWLMEPVAMKLQFWSWKNNEIPVYNYISWFVISFLISSVFFKMKLAYTNRFAPVLLIIQSIFFLFLRIFLN